MHPEFARLPLELQAVLAKLTAETQARIAKLKPSDQEHVAALYAYRFDPELVEKNTPQTLKGARRWLLWRLEYKPNLKSLPRFLISRAETPPSQTIRRHGQVLMK
jgi:hypothetical protein